MSQKYNKLCFWQYPVASIVSLKTINAMKIIEQFRGDLKERKNIQTYFVGIVALSALLANLASGIANALTDIHPIDMSGVNQSVMLVCLVAIIINQLFNTGSLEFLKKKGNHGGIVGATDSLSRKELDHRISSAEREVHIINTWLTAKGTQSLPQLNKCLERGNDVKILVLNPLSELVKTRSEALGLGRNNIEALAGLRSLIQSVDAKQYKLDKHIRIYDTIPPFALYSVDDWVLVGLYWHGKCMGAIEKPHFEVQDHSSSFGECIRSTFNSIWNSATPYSKWAKSHKWELKDLVPV